MNSTSIKVRHKQLCESLRRYELAYYGGEPLVSDDVYDSLYRELQQLEEEHPELYTEDSPTHKLSYQPVSSFKKRKHGVPMLSIRTILKDDHGSVINALKRMNEAYGEMLKKGSYVFELKLDGVSLSAIYEKGVLTAAVLRGNGYEGEDVYNNALAILNLPKRLLGSYPPYVEVRGEVLMPLAKFSEINERLVASGETPLKSPRNAAAGAMRSLDPSVVLERGLIFIAHGVGEWEGKKPPTQTKLLKSFKEMGFKTVPHYTSELTTVAFIFCDKVEGSRIDLEWEIDGIVMKVDDFDVQRKLGFSHKEPRWAVALKFEPERVTSVVEAIDLQVGRTGILTPVARIRPVIVGGVEVSNVTLHNQAFIDDKGVRVGDTVVISRGGDVIPKIEEVILSLSQEDSKPYRIEEVNACPACGHGIEKEGAGWYCMNSSSCSGQLEGRIEHFISRKAMNIMHLGEKRVASAIRLGLLQRPADIYRWTQEDVSRILMYGMHESEGPTAQALSNKILDSIKASTRPSLARFFYSLNIRGVGEVAAKALAYKYRTIENFLKADPAEFYTIENVNLPTAARLVEALEDETWLKDLQDLLEYVNPLELKVIADQQPLKGKTFAITGIFAWHRDMIKELIEEKGGKVSSSVSAKTTAILLGDLPGEAKVKAAQKHNIPAITLDALLEMLKSEPT